MQAKETLGRLSWRLLDTGLGGAAWNMALDRTLLEGSQKGMSRPTVRFYSWRVPSVSVGHGQNSSAAVDLAACRRLAIPVVRRPTGGRTVLHAREFTYSVTAPVAGLPLALYGAVCDALVAGLQLLGVDAARVRPRLVDRAVQVARSTCFASFSREEVELGGKKLIGSAQRRKRGCFLQQGSMPIDNPIPLMSEVLAGREEAGFVRVVEQRLTWLGAHLSVVPPWEELVRVMAEGFRLAWSTRLPRGKLSQWEVQRTNELLSGAGQHCEEAVPAGQWTADSEQWAVGSARAHQDTHANRVVGCVSANQAVRKDRLLRRAGGT